MSWYKLLLHKSGIIAFTLKQFVCTGPVRYRDLTAVQRDLDNLRSAAADFNVADLFMTAISPGMVKRTRNAGPTARSSLTSASRATAS